MLKYVGITKRDPLLRFAEHARSGGKNVGLEFEVLKAQTNLTREQARIIEQTVINKYGMEKNGGQLYNLINSISPKHWNKFNIK